MTTMSGHVEAVGASYAVIVNGETVAFRPDEQSAEDCLMQIYLFRNDAEQNKTDGSLEQ